MIQSSNHILEIYRINQTFLSCLDDKRYIADGGIETLYHGHKDICWFNTVWLKKSVDLAILIGSRSDNDFFVGSV